MEEIVLQLNRTLDGSVEYGGTIVFDRVEAQGEIEYDNETGVITFLKTGRYDLNWWVAIQSARSTVGAGFAFVTSAGDILYGNSPTKTGQVSGVGTIVINEPSVKGQVLNFCSGTMYYPMVVSGGADGVYRVYGIHGVYGVYGIHGVYGVYGAG